MKHQCYLFVSFLFIGLLFTSCYGKCKGGDEVYHETPASFSEKLYALKNYQEWVYSNGKGQYDTLRAVSNYTPFTFKDREFGCDVYENGDREFDWSLAGRIYTSKQTFFKTSINHHNREVSSSLKCSKYKACTFINYDYDINKETFLSTDSIVKGYNTPYQYYEDVHYFRLYLKYEETKGALLYSVTDGPIAYIVETDTFKLVNLVK